MSHDWTHIPSLQEFEDGDIISATEMNDLHDEIKNSVNDFVDEVDAVVNVIEEDIDDLEELTTGHSATLTQHGLDISAHTSMLSSHTSTLSNHGSRLTSVEANQEIDEGNIEELGIRMTDAEEAIDDLETLTAQHTTTIASHSTRLTDVENAQETDADNIELITERLGNAEDDIDDLEGDVATVKSTVSSHTSTLSSHTSTLTEHGNRLTQDGEYIIALEEAMTELAGNISDLDGNVTELSEEVSDLNTDLNTLASKKAGTTLGLVKASTAQATDTQPVRITNDGYLVTAPGGGGGGNVDDVQINGTSIVDEDGVANIPLMGSSVNGVARKATNATIDSRNTSFVVDCGHLDYAVKVALTDGIGVTYTPAEQQAAQQRLGISGGGGETEIFRAEYEVTTYNEINEAYNDGKMMIAFDSSGREHFFVSKNPEGTFIFRRMGEASSVTIYINTSSQWNIYEIELVRKLIDDYKTVAKSGLTNGGTWTTAQQQAAQQLLGISGGGGESGIAIFSYTQVTYNEIRNAITAGQIPIINYADDYFYWYSHASTVETFQCVKKNGLHVQVETMTVNSSNQKTRETLLLPYERFTQYTWDGVSGTATRQDAFGVLSGIMYAGGTVKAILKTDTTRYVTSNVKFASDRIDFFFDEITDYIPGDVVTFKRLRVTHTSSNTVSVSHENINIDL